MPGGRGWCCAEVQMSAERPSGDLAHPGPRRLQGPAFTFYPTDSGICALGSQGNCRRWQDSVLVWNSRPQKKRHHPVPLRLSELGFERHLKGRSHRSLFPASAFRPVPTVSSAVCTIHREAPCSRVQVSRPTACPRPRRTHPPDSPKPSAKDAALTLQQTEM